MAKMVHKLFINSCLFAAFFFAGCTSEQLPEPKTIGSASYVGAEVCAECHANEYESWRNSHHDLAMQNATAETVLGDFDDALFQYGEAKTKFFRRNNRYYVSTDGANGDTSEYEVAYTFGVDPLQQYLVRFPDGRLQALSISWDARSADEGGQRWYHLYPDEQIDHTDILHWTGPFQNWNFMCAECHSTDVRKNFSVGANSFATSWSEIDVACEACHGPGSIHAKSANQSEVKNIMSFADDSGWIMDATTGIARRTSARQSHSELETCARCHSRRSILSEDYEHGEPLVNTHRPALLDEDLYYADGQILDEVYVYGSFLQSKMHNAGVTCTDCHNAHSLALKADGNALCAQCHLPTVFDTQEHHRHEQQSTAAECVSCHMPSRTYMGIDERHDHSFRVPRPDLSARIGTPNACNTCHDNQNADWAAAKIVEWFGSDQALHYGDVLDAGRRSATGAAASLIALANDETSPAIVRATAVSLLPRNPGEGIAVSLNRAARSEEVLLRLAAADAAGGLTPAMQVDIVAPLLSNTSRSVRLSAAATLMHVPRNEMRQAQAEELSRVLEEYEQAQILNADRAEANVNLGVLYSIQGKSVEAERAYLRAIEIVPEFPASYINLAEHYRAVGRDTDVDDVLNRGLEQVPNSADLHHTLGLSKVRQGNYEDAISMLRNAYEFAPDRAHYAYVLGIALNSTGDSGGALTVLNDAHELHPTDRNLLIALATISRDTGKSENAMQFARQLLALSPNDRIAEQLISELQP